MKLEQLLFQLHAQNERNKGRMLTLEAILALKPASDGVSCDEVAHMVVFCQMYLEGAMQPADIEWNDTELRKLNHVLNCDRCQALSHAELPTEINDIVDQVVERLKTDPRINEEIREATLIGFGPPKDPMAIN